MENFSHMKTRFPILFLIAASLAGCAHGPAPLGGSSAITVIDASVLPPPAGVDAADVTRPYRVGPMDELLVDVAGIDQLRERRIVVDGNGRISVPIAGEVIAGGRTPAEVEREVVYALRTNHVRNPVVSVNLSQARSQTVAVDGEVKEPGIYPVVGRMTLMQAVARARGTSEFAALEDVVVFRTVGDQRMVALFNLAAIRRGAYPDPEIFANDTVIVGDSSGRRLFRDVLQASPLFISPIIAILQNM
jgi:polysaccharide export outer membrane protein